MGKSSRTFKRSNKESDVVPGIAAIMITCSRNQEARCTSEALQIFDRVLDEQQQEQEADENISSDDEAESKEYVSFEDELAKEVGQMRKGSGKKLQALRPGELSCIVFLKCIPSLGDPVELVKKLFETQDGKAMHSSRFCQRIIPLSKIIRADLQDLKVAILDLIAPIFHTPDAPKYTYSVAFESRLSHSLDRLTTISLIADLVGSKHKVDLIKPSLTIMVQVFKGMCGLAVLPNYFEYNKYNVQEFYRVKNTLEADAGIIE